MNVGQIIKGLKKERITSIYADNDRYIPQALYSKLKKQTHCSKCNKRPKSKLLEIHHLVKVCDGGKNDDKNLVAVCSDCHKQLHQR